MASYYLIGTGNACKDACNLLIKDEASQLAGLATVPEDALAKEAVAGKFIYEGDVDALTSHVAGCRPDILLSVFSPIMLSDEILAIPAKYAVNLHPGLLPAYTGFYPHLWAIINGEKSFGVTLHQMNSRLDSGPVFGSEYFAIGDDDTGIKVYMNCVKASRALISRFIDSVNQDRVEFKEQDSWGRKNYKKKDMSEFCVDVHTDIDTAMRAYMAYQFKPFVSPLGDLRLRVNGRKYTVQRMRKATSGEEYDNTKTIHENYDGSVALKMVNGWLILEEVDNVKAVNAFKTSHADQI